MKATKAELIRLARLAQKDIASGRGSKNAQQAVEVLADYENSAIELLDLTLEEAKREKSKKSLVDSCAFLFGQSLETLRFDIEGGAIGLHRNSQKVFGSGWSPRSKQRRPTPALYYLLFSALALRNSILVKSCAVWSRI
jgi:hypothetical protein